MILLSSSVLKLKRYIKQYTIIFIYVVFSIDLKLTNVNFDGALYGHFSSNVL